jgi:hypothetical protein
LIDALVKTRAHNGWFGLYEGGSWFFFDFELLALIQYSQDYP